ncbi:hypothetical protein SAMN05216404_102295 [Nitrosospira multiformis]|uniref:Uncharacterized protein n=1 Tax=Nitrosospira multiformis TaxID=1231 RepID=A0A1H8DMH1_9PROT|nr:hypothetical protein SAMN05216404_102295 [Nitrosospira multiformis]
MRHSLSTIHRAMELALLLAYPLVCTGNFPLQEGLKFT